VRVELRVEGYGLREKEGGGAGCGEAAARHEGRLAAASDQELSLAARRLLSAPIEGT